eukprot:gnl/MRDRNA2_/MRDRNA2_180041_c0_seq1.p1 gnl/MRDRNA2_/MRDRNA2_180041_c0~~gnl/MRDRNA2_/MRDRNA2_180041_c0_seq1.p1  ORF type:complete len:259 (+),score=32.61 gnl/MRDRNA2_/MRDRNA2_180041_c0_seq1:76-852(+)
MMSSDGVDVGPRREPELDDNMKQTWAQASIVLNETELRIQGHSVMEAWEHPYMKRLAEIATQNGGHILELGFGMGISATYCQEVGKNLLSHHIIEANNQVAMYALKWSAEKARSKVVIHRGYSWDVAPSLRDSYFDGILYDTYPLEPGKAGRHHRDFIADAARLLKPGGVFTYFCSVFPSEDRQLLNDHGFEVATEWISAPPSDSCLYWNYKYLIAPTCIKSKKESTDDDGNAKRRKSKCQEKESSDEEGREFLWNQD